MYGTRLYCCALLALGMALPAPAQTAPGHGTRVVIGFKGRVDEDVLARYGLTSKRRLHQAVVTVVAPAAIPRLRGEAVVAYVEQDQVAALPAGRGVAQRPGNGGGGKKKDQPAPAPAQTTPWGILRVGGIGSGSGTVVAIIDTGCDLDHEDLAANLVAGINYVRSGKPPDDDHGHGTHTAGTVAALNNQIGVVGVAPAASIMPIKALDRRGSGWQSDIAAGVDWAVAHGAQVLNMSLGGSGYITALLRACDDAAAAGRLVVASAGNSGDGDLATPETSYPAAFASVVSVGATDSWDLLATFSSTHPTVELSAPGVGVMSTYKGNQYATWSGTSMAAPHVSGCAAVLWSDYPSAAAVRDELARRAADRGPTGRDDGYGFGIVQHLP